MVCFDDTREDRQMFSKSYLLKQNDLNGEPLFGVHDSLAIVTEDQ